LISTFSLLFAYCLPQFCISLMPSILCSPCLHRIFWWVCQKCSNHTVSSSRRVWLEQNHVPSPIDSMFWFSTRRTEKEMKFRHRMKWCLLSWIKRYYSGVLLPRFGKTCWNNDVENMGLCCYLFPPNKLLFPRPMNLMGLCSGARIQDWGVFGNKFCVFSSLLLLEAERYEGRFMIQNDAIANLQDPNKGSPE